MSILYRIYTEDRNRGDIIEYVSSFFWNGFTTLNGVGYWHGQAESCLVIEIIHDSEDAEITVKNIARWIQKHNAQESVAVTKQEIEVWTIGEKL
jgi:hypothetical protein